MIAEKFLKRQFLPQIKTGIQKNEIFHIKKSVFVKEIFVNFEYRTQKKEKIPKTKQGFTK